MEMNAMICLQMAPESVSTCKPGECCVSPGCGRAAAAIVVAAPHQRWRQLNETQANGRNTMKRFLGSEWLKLYRSNGVQKIQI